MPTFSPPKRGVAYVFYVSLVSQANTKTFQASPVLATGDVKVALDDAAPVNLATLPVIDADFTKRVKVSLSAAEMTGDRITVIFSDTIGDEWCDLSVDIATAAKQFDDIPTVADIAAAVWAATERSLTTFGTLIADVWSYTTRTLTQTAAQVTAAVSGSDLTIVRAVTFEATLTGLTIPATWSKVYFTVKRHLGAPDADALVQVASGVGLTVLNKAAATNAAWGSLTVNQAAGTVAILLADEATATLAQDNRYEYDLKALLADGSSVLLTQGDVAVALTSTETIT